MTEMIQPTPEEVRGWLDQSVGKYHINQLNQMVTDLKDAWASGDFTGMTNEKTIQLNSEAIGKAQQIGTILLTLDEMCTDEPEEKPEDNTY